MTPFQIGRGQTPPLLTAQSWFAIGKDIEAYVTFSISQTRKTSWVVFFVVISHVREFHIVSSIDCQRKNPLLLSFRNLSFWKNDLYYSLRPNLFSCLGRQSFRSHSITVVLYVWLPFRLSAKKFFPCFLLMLFLFGFSLSDFCCCCCFVSPKKKRKSNARSQGPCRFLSNSAAMQFPAVWPCLARLPVCARITAPCWQRQMQWTHARTETRRTCIETTFERADK